MSESLPTNEKQEIWNSFVSRVESITDGLGKTVDSGIKETVVAFLANDLETSGSCEGHLDRARPYPWVHVEYVLDTPEFQERVNDLRTKMKQAGYRGISDIPDTDSDLYDTVQHLRKESEEHKEDVEETLRGLLDEFYSLRQPLSEDYRLGFSEGGSFFVVEPISGAGIGKDNWAKFEKGSRICLPIKRRNTFGRLKVKWMLLLIFLGTTSLQPRFCRASRNRLCPLGKPTPPVLFTY